MNIERLTARNKDGIAYLVNVKPDEQEVDSPHKNTLKCILDCFERLAQYEDEAIARQSETEKVVCPDCGGSGVYQEYDEYDRYYVHACHECEGAGEIADIDQTNIYSYRGNSFMLDFEKYLLDHSITVDEIELMNGMIGIWLPNEKNPIKFPQYARWLDIASKLKGGGK